MKSTRRSISRLALNKRYLEDACATEGYYAASDAQRDDWMTGLSEGYANWVDEATDYSSMAADGMKQAMGGAVTTITDMLNGNVDSWKDWGISVLKIVENVAINMALANGVSSLGSFFSFGASSSAAASSGTAIQNAGANFTFNAKGNVYDSPSLSAYSNGVFQTPQLLRLPKERVYLRRLDLKPLCRLPVQLMVLLVFGLLAPSGLWWCAFS